MTSTSIAETDLDTPSQREFRAELRALLVQRVAEYTASAPAHNLLDEGSLWVSVATALTRAGVGLTDERGGRHRMWDMLSVAAQELGRVPVDVPFLTSSIMAATIARRVGQRVLASQLLQGTMTATFLTPYQEPVQTDSRGQFRDGRVWASVPGVAGATRADIVLVLCGDTLVSVDREWVQVTPCSSVDDSRLLVDVDIRGARGSVLAVGDSALFAVEAAAEAASVMLAVEQASMAAACTRLTSGPFEAGQMSAERHHASLDKAASAARYACDCVAVEDPHAKVAVSTARMLCSTVAFRAARAAAEFNQTNCSITALLVERARGSALAFGGPLWHRRRLAQLMASPLPIEKSRKRRSR